MSKDDMIGKLALWSFIGGALIAIVVGIIYVWQETLFVDYSFIAWILAILGGIVGILAFLGKGTITKTEVPAFLMASMALLVMYAVFRGISGMVPILGSLLEGVSLSLAIFIAPAVGILAIKVIWEIGKDV
jgi:hypothetical protein